MCVIRSTWDYHQKPGEFHDCLAKVSERTRVVNPPGVVLWNSHKFYLRDLEQRGVPVVPSEWLDLRQIFDLGDILQRRGWDEAVIKPAHGASSHGVIHLKAGEDRTRAIAGLAASRLLRGMGRADDHQHRLGF